MSSWNCQSETGWLLRLSSFLSDEEEESVGEQPGDNN